MEPIHFSHFVIFVNITIIVVVFIFHIIVIIHWSALLNHRFSPSQDVPELCLVLTAPNNHNQ